MPREVLLDLPFNALVNAYGRPEPLVDVDMWVTAYSWVYGLTEFASQDRTKEAALDAHLREKGFPASLPPDALVTGLLGAATGNPILAADVSGAHMSRYYRDTAGNGRIYESRDTFFDGRRVHSTVVVTRTTKRAKLLEAVKAGVESGGTSIPIPARRIPPGMLRTVMQGMLQAELDDDLTYEVPVAALIACLVGAMTPFLTEANDPGARAARKARRIKEKLEIRQLLATQQGADPAAVEAWRKTQREAEKLERTAARLEAEKFYRIEEAAVGDDPGAREFIHVMRRAVVGQRAAIKALEGFVAQSIAKGVAPSAATLATWADRQGLLRVSNDVMLTFRRWLMGFLPAMLDMATLHRAPGPQTGHRPSHLTVPPDIEHPDAVRYITAWRAIDEACAKFHTAISERDWYPRFTCLVTSELHRRAALDRYDAMQRQAVAPPVKRKSRPLVGSNDEVKVPYAFRQVPHRVMLRRQRKPGLFNTMTPEEQYAWRVAQAAKARAAREANRRARAEQEALLANVATHSRK